MKRETVLSLIRDHRSDLKTLGVKSLAVFGSVARDDAGPQSDVDVLVEFNAPITFDRFMDTRIFLEDLIGCRVDLVMPQAIRPPMRSRIMGEAVYVA